MGTKLYPPYHNQDCSPVILTQKVFFNAWRTAACEVVLALAGSVFDKVGSYKQRDMPIQQTWHWSQGYQLPNSSESNCSYLAAIFSARELNSLGACSTVSWLTGMDIITINRSNFNVICDVNTVNTDQKETHLYSVKFKSKLTVKLEKKLPKWVIVSSRTGVSKDQRVNWVKYANIQIRS